MLAQILVLGFFPAAMAWAAGSDLVTMTISNKLVLALVAGFFVVALALSLPASVIALHVSAGMAVLAVSFALFCAGWIGGGDAKFVAAVALWLGFDQLFGYLLISSIYGGMLTMMLITFRRVALPGFLLDQQWLHRLHAPTTGVPYGIALAAAALSVYPQSALLKLAAGFGH